MRIPILLFFCMAMSIFHNAVALKMIPAEDMCAQQGLQPGTPEYAACLEQEQKRQAALIQAIMINEQAPVAQQEITLTEPAAQTPAEPTAEQTIQSLTSPEASGQAEPMAHMEDAPTKAISEEKSMLETAPTTPPAIVLQQRIIGKIKPDVIAQTASNECNTEITDHEFAVIDSCIPSVEINEAGDTIQPTVFPPACAPSADDLKHL